MPSKTNKKEKKNCTDHSLVLKPKNSFCHYGQTLNIDFCKKAISSGKGKKIENSCFEGPVFNKDGNFQTPTFIIASEKKNYEPKDFKNGIENNNRYSTVDYEKSLLLVPKPNSKSMYCSVCKQKYEEYIQHIKTPKHKNNIRSNKFTFYIQQHAEVFKEKNPLHAANTNTESNVIIISDDEDDERSPINQLGIPTKRVKKNPEHQENKINLGQPNRIQSLKTNPINPMMQNPSFCVNPSSMFGAYPFNYNFGLGLPNFLPFNQNFPSMLPTLPQLPNFGCLAPQSIPTNQVHYGILPRRSNYALIQNDQ